jgi:hypothetical protein
VSQRSLIWLGAILAVLVLLAVLGQRQNAPTPTNVDRAFLPGLMDQLDAVTEVEIVGAGNTPVATLDRGADGWTVRQKGGYRADLTKVRHMLLTLAEAHVLETKTANPEFYGMLGVEDVESADAGGLDVTLIGPTPPVEIIVGDAAGEYRRYVRQVGDAQTYLINRDPEIGEMTADWLDTAIIDLEASRVEAVTVAHPDGEAVHVSKASADQPNFTVDGIPEGRTLLYDSVANVMASVLQNLSLEDVEPASDSDLAETETRIETFDGLTLTIRGFERDGGAWIRISATGVPTSGDADRESDAADPATEAAGINARLDGWRFKIPTYKFEQLTRRMDALLKAQP